MYILLAYAYQSMYANKLDMEQEMADSKGLQNLKNKIKMTIPQYLWLSFFEIDRNKIDIQKEFLKTAFMLNFLDEQDICLDDNTEITEIETLLAVKQGDFEVIDTLIKYWKAHDKKAYDKEELCLQNFDEQLYLRWNEHLDQFMYTEEEFNKTVYDKWVPYVDEIIELYKDVTKKITVSFYNAKCSLDPNVFHIVNLINSINEIIKEFNLDVTNILDEGEKLLTINN